ncbi:MAG TPA: alpha-xylosidase [Candidatus Limiplasma sp.]|nr:alpha-xylosidase [Candidatus Limiplasma sp.]HRX08202.1 alpha-xylosidase [Candidatus Limiplasma sp.]
MKFTDGFWLTKPGVELFNCAQVQDARWDGDAYAVYCSYTAITHRGMTLTGPMLTLRFTAPREGILSVKVSNYEGISRKEPRFTLYTDGSKAAVEDHGDTITITSGTLKAVVTRQRFSLRFFENGRELTGFGARHLGCAKTPDGWYMRAKLDVDVGETLYGLGERFTPFVKNGQTVDIWNEDGGTSSELAYKNIPFYVTSKGYGVFVNSTGRVSFELCSEAVESAQVSLPGHSLDLVIVGGGDMKTVLSRYTALTGRPALPPAWSFGLWLTTSFTTEYNEETINEFVDGMAQRDIPLHVFHFDCFWMKAYEWCNFAWDKQGFPDPEGLIRRLHGKGLKTCVWINPYIGQKSPLFQEGRDRGYFLKRPNGDVWQWDMWQAGMAIVDFTNPDACKWYQDKLKALLDMGVDSFKTDFGERIPVDCAYFDGSDPVGMHNDYTQLYNKTVFELLERERGEGEACLFARSATAGGQQYPVHWGGDCSSTYASMAESLRAGLSLCMSGFAFWSHDISGFEDTATEDVYVRWAQFGLLSSHSRLHGSTSYRVPWLFGEQAVQAVRDFSKLKCRLMPYLFAASVEAHQTGIPVMRAMAMEFFGDPACEALDRQYMLGGSLLVAPVFRRDGHVDYYLPQGTWTHLLTGEVKTGGAWQHEEYALSGLPLFVRENTILPLGASQTQVDYDYLQGLELHLYHPVEGVPAELRLADSKGNPTLTIHMNKQNGQVTLTVEGKHPGIAVILHGGAETRAELKPDQTEIALP